MSLVSVIIPCFNAAPWLSKTLDSCLAQQEFIREIIVVDDFSTDESWLVLEDYHAKYPGLIQICRNRSKGGNSARNLGFELSKGPFIQWLDADDQITPGKFSAQLSQFDRDPSTDIVYSDWAIHTYRQSELSREELKKNGPVADFLRELLVDHWSAPHVYLIKRSKAQELHDLLAWNPQTPVFQDREYFTIAAILGSRFSYVPGCYAIYNRWNKSSVSAAGKDSRYESLEKILNRFELLIRDRPDIPPRRREACQRIINTQKLLIRAAGYRAEFHYGTIRLSTVHWQIVKGIRTTLKVIREVFRTPANPSKSSVAL